MLTLVQKPWLGGTLDNLMYWSCWIRAWAFLNYLLFFNCLIISYIHCILFNLCIFNIGYGHMTRQPQLLEMQRYTVEQRLCHLSGSVNLTVWYDVAISAITYVVLNALLYIMRSACFWVCLSFWQKLLIGTADGGIKAWNVDAKRVVCDLNTTEAFPRYLRCVID